MLFNSFEYLVFFPTVACLYFILPFRFRWIILLAASYYFYMAWKAEYIFLIIGSTLIDYFCSRKIGELSSKRTKLLYLYLSLLSNLSVLFLFKYFNFFTTSVNVLFSTFNWNASIPLTQLILPMGISFYTFQTMSYTIDVYKGKLKPEKHLGVFALFVSFFPQLVAGPIERAENLLHQFRQKFSFDYTRITDGLKLIAWGMFKKVVIADRLAIMVDNVYSDPTAFTGIPLILATVFFSFQIYCDFSGYSDIAIGSAQVLGFRLMDNFNRPYFSKSIGEFWKRWHISLSTWFRDYLYIPLGGNRVVKWRWYYNLFITFLISGLWHGANWTFVLWGALHGVYLIMGIITKSYRIKFVDKLGLNEYPLLHKNLNVFSTFILVSFAWIFFRANHLQDALHIVSHLFTHSMQQVQPIITNQDFAREKLLYLGVDKTTFIISIGSIIFMEFVHVIQRHNRIRQMLRHRPFLLRWSIYLTMIFSIIFFGIFNRAEFIYFQF